MGNQLPEDNNKQKEDPKKTGLPPDPETLDKTDPQEHMEGPISSLVKGIGHTVEKNEETKEEADARKEKNL